MLTDREKALLLEIVSKINFQVGQSSLAREFEVIAQKLQQKEEKKDEVEVPSLSEITETQN